MQPSTRRHDLATAGEVADDQRGTAPSDPLSEFRDLPSRVHARNARVILEGRVVIERALACGVHLEKVVGTFETLQSLTPRLEERTKVTCLAPPQLRALVGFDFHRGLLSLVARPAYSDVDELERSLAHLAVVLVLDRVSDPRNVGALLRSAKALGVEHVLLGPGCGDPFHRIALRASMGNAFTLHLYEADDLAACLGRLSSRTGARVSVATLDRGAQEVSPTTTCAGRTARLLVVGNEGEGVSEGVHALADERLRIPVASESDSLNVAVATSMLLWWLSAAGRA